jgi:hypothetical protein
MPYFEQYHSVPQFYDLILALPSILMPIRVNSTHLCSMMNRLMLVTVAVIGGARIFSEG